MVIFLPKSRNEEVEMGVVPLIITPSDPLAKFLLSISATLGSARLKALVSKGRMLTPGDIIILNIDAAIWLLWAPHTSELTGKEGGYCTE